MTVLKSKTGAENDKRLQIGDYGKRRLLTYADSFRELARSFEGGFACEEEADRQRLLEARKLWENRQVLCSNLNEMAKIMTKVASEVFRYRPLEGKKHRLVFHALKSEGILAEDLFYIEQAGNRMAIGACLRTTRQRGYRAEDVADMLSVLLNLRLSVSGTSPYRVEQEKQNFIFVEEARFLVLTGFAKAVKETEEISGDNYSIIESEKGKMTVLLSDGMGSGAKACEESGKVLDLMEKMLEAGYGLDAAVNLVNNALLARGEEQNMSTLDICDLDLYEGSCEFRKIGGAVSFLKREQEVEQIASHNLPLGIFQQVNPEVVRRELSSGDYIIMMSDGVLDALEGNNYEEAMRRIISDIREQNPKEIADRLLQFVLHCSNGRIQDDMMIVVIGIWKNR